MKKLLHGVFPELLLSLDTCVLTGNTNAFIWYCVDGVFGIGTMLIQYLYCEFGLSVLVRCRRCVGGKIGALSRAVLCSAFLGVSKNVLVGLTI